MKNEETPLFGYRIKWEPDDPNAWFFETSNAIIYEVRFKPSGYIFVNDPEIQPFVFEISIAVLENPMGKRPPSDPLLLPTIAKIFGIFFEQHERIVLYICDTSDERGSARQRKFTSWFNYYRGNYIQISEGIYDEAGVLYEFSFIIRSDNPHRLRLMLGINELLIDYRK